MAVYTMEVTTEYVFPNLIVYKKLKDGVHYAWRVVPVEGYVMYDTAANWTDIDPVTGEEIPVIYYYTSLDCPLNANFDNFTWVAVPRDSVDENYIFGVDEPEHEVM